MTATNIGIPEPRRPVLKAPGGCHPVAVAPSDDIFLGVLLGDNAVLLIQKGKLLLHGSENESQKLSRAYLLRQMLSPQPHPKERTSHWQARICHGSHPQVYIHLLLRRQLNRNFMMALPLLKESLEFAQVCSCPQKSNTCS